MLWNVSNPTRKHFASSAFPLEKLGFDTKMTIYAGFVAVVVNIAVAVLATLILKSAKVTDGPDRTSEPDYFVDEDEPRGELTPTEAAVA